MKKFLFVDTNIYLDFYRYGDDVGIDLLKHLESISDQIIVTYQVDMEFKNNRQKVILETINKIDLISNIPRPGILSEDRTFKALSKTIQVANKSIKKLRDRLQRALENPKRYDPVYKLVNKIFNKNDDLNLTREKIVKNQIRRLAFRRFHYGYPPRKKSDTSIGDAVNWEWICEIAKIKNSDIIIVSRDSDYGISFGKKTYINDWLKEEFRGRTNIQRKIILTTKLSDALKIFKVSVTPEEEESEETLIKKLAFYPSQQKSLEGLITLFKPPEEALRQLKELNDMLDKLKSPFKGL